MIIILINTILNICRGGRYLPNHLVFSKWAITLYQMLIFMTGMIYLNQPFWLAIIYILPHTIELLIGTGEQMQAGNPNPFPIDKSKPLNKFLARLLKINPDIASDADKRRLGAWYCSVIGAIHATPFIFLSYFIFPLIIFLHIALLAGYRYIKPITWFNQEDLRWRIFKEGLFFGIYTSLFWYAI